METKKWWYAAGSEPKGPLRDEEIKDLLLTGELAADALVWTEGMETWIPADRSGLAPPPLVSSAIAVANPSPWRRFWARMIDIFFISLVIPWPLNLLLWIPVEALLLATWTYTPGKWLLGIKVTDAEEGKLDFDTALHRAFLVWLKGLCIGIPIANLVTFYLAYRRLKSEGKTSWDSDLNLQVLQETVPTYRKVLLAAFIVFYLLAFTYVVVLIQSGQLVL